MPPHTQPFLTDNDWIHLTDILTFQHGSIGLLFISDLHPVDSSFPFDPKTFVDENRPIQVDLIPEPMAVQPGPNYVADSCRSCLTQTRTTITSQAAISMTLPLSPLWIK